MIKINYDYLRAITILEKKTVVSNRVVGASIPDLSKNYDEKAKVEDGMLYRKGNMIQVVWFKDALGRPKTAIKKLLQHLTKNRQKRITKI